MQDSSFRLIVRRPAAQLLYRIDTGRCLDWSRHYKRHCDQRPRSQPASLPSHARGGGTRWRSGIHQRHLRQRTAADGARPLRMAIRSAWAKRLRWPRRLWACGPSMRGRLPPWQGHNRARNMHPRHHTTMGRLNKPLSPAPIRSRRRPSSSAPNLSNLWVRLRLPGRTLRGGRIAALGGSGMRLFPRSAHRVVGDRRHHRRCEVLVGRYPRDFGYVRSGVKPDATCR